MDDQRRLIIGLILLATAVAVAVFATAIFTASSASAGNLIASGLMSVDQSKHGAALLSASDLLPGQSATGMVTLSNTGAKSGSFTLSTIDLTDTPGVPGGPPLSARALLLIENVTSRSSPVRMYSGLLDGVGTLQLGRWAAGATHAFRFVLSLPTDVKESLYGQARTRLVFVWGVSS